MDILAQSLQKKTQEALEQKKKDDSTIYNCDSEIQNLQTMLSKK